MESNSKCDSLSPQALEQILRTARTHNAFSDDPVPEALLREIYELTKWGPTSANGSPGRFVFLTTPQAQARLRPHLSKANQRKRLGAAVQVLIAYDLRFADYFPRLFPHNPAVSTWFADPQLAQETALRNGSLQGAYLMIAARALGLDCGPMSGLTPGPWMRSSSPVLTGAPTSSATSATAPMGISASDCPGLRSRKPAASSSR